MIYRKLTVSGDYSFGHGLQDFYQNQPEAPAQAVQTRLGLWLGQWFLDLLDGTAWATQVLGPVRGGSAYDAVVRDRILGTLNVTEILSYSSVLNTRARTLSIQTTIRTTYSAAAQSLALTIATP